MEDYGTDCADYDGSGLKSIGIRCLNVTLDILITRYNQYILHYMKAKQGFKLRPLGDEYILVGESIEQINFNKMITLNDTAAFLWQKVADGQPFDADKLATWLTDEYDVSREQALEDSQKTIDTWLNAGIIV